ncbi:aminoglycoside phosphotransferase family protein [Virgibacillus pantothenticus]|uniref:phosphotransferase n=1 Tax=Virgibacillus pantothenticus TaxID=1473 RepID=UPI003D2A345A
MIYNFLNNYKFKGEVEFEIVKSRPNIIYLIKNNNEFYIVKFYSQYTKIFNEVSILQLLNFKNVQSIEIIRNNKDKYITPITGGEKMYGVIYEFLYEQEGKQFNSNKNAKNLLNKYMCFKEVLNTHYNFLNTESIVHYNKEILIERPLTKIKGFKNIAKFTSRLKEIEGKFSSKTSSENIPTQIIHGDLHRGNILFSKDITFIDFEDIGWGSPLLDISSLLIEGDKRSSEYENSIIKESIQYFGSKSVEQDLFYYKAINYLVTLSRGDVLISDTLITKYLTLIEDCLLKGGL